MAPAGHLLPAVAHSTRTDQVPALLAGILVLRHSSQLQQRQQGPPAAITVLFFDSEG